MTIPEKIEVAKRKKIIGVRFLKAKDYPKALDIFEHINSFFSFGLSEEKEKQAVKGHK